MPIFGGSGVGLNLKGGPTNVITLQAGQVYYPNSNPNPQVPGQGIGKAGWFYIRHGRYTNVQLLDPITQIWRGIGDESNGFPYLQTDGVNMRLANQSGCAVAAVVTTAGSAYTSAPTVVASAGSSTWRAILGPVISTTITVSYGGTNYTYPPVVVIDAPPVGGVQASAYATLTSGVVSSITVVNQGAGYSGGVPNVILVNDVRDITGSGATATAALVASGAVAAVVCTDHGNPITSGTVPTLTFGSGSAAATVLMNWGITTYAATTPGAGYGNSAFIDLTAVGPAEPTAAANTAGPDVNILMVRKRKASIWVPTNSTGGFTTGGEIVDGGVYIGVPTALYQSGTLPTTVGALTLTLGGFVDTSFISPW